MILTKFLFIFSTAAIYVSILRFVKVIEFIDQHNFQLHDSNKLDPIYELMPTNGGS